MLLSCLLSTLAAAPRFAAAQDGTRYLRRGASTSDLELLAEPPTNTGDARQIEVSLRNGEAALLGTFLTPAAMQVSAGAVNAFLFLGTGREGIAGCAEVTWRGVPVRTIRTRCRIASRSARSSASAR